MGTSRKFRGVLLSAASILISMGLVTHALAGDRFFVSDKVAKKVFKYDDSFAYNTDWATTLSNGAPDDVYITADHVYVLDSVSKKVFRYDYSGGNMIETKTLKVTGNPSAADIGTPVGMTVDPAANELWVADGNRRLYKYSLSNAFSAGSSINATNQYTLHVTNSQPHGIAVDTNYVYVLDRGHERLFRYSRSNPASGHTPSRKFRDESGVRLTQPEGMAVAGDFLYILNNDTENRVHLYSLTEMFLPSDNISSFVSYPLAPGNNDPFGLGIDKTRSAVSINPTTVGPTNADSVSFNVIFDEPVTNFNDAADVLVQHNGTANTGVTITGSGSVYTLSVDGLTGDGTFTVEINIASDIQNPNGDPLIASATSPAVLIDNTAPKAELLTPLSGSELEITFTEANGMSPDAALPATYTATGPGMGLITANPTSVTDLGNNVYRLTWTPGGMVNGLTMTISVDSGLTDLAGNPVDVDFGAVSVIALPVSLSGFTIE